MREILFWSFAVVVGALINSVSQIILKKAAMKKYPSHLREYLNFPVIGAYVLAVAVTLINCVAYKHIPISLGAILTASGYLFVTLGGMLCFKEKLGLKKLLALGMILTGIVIYAI